MNAESKAEAFIIFDGLSADGQIEIPMAEENNRACFAMFRDKIGIEWMVAFEPY